jgi:hypothetical protein
MYWSSPMREPEKTSIALTKTLGGGYRAPGDAQ